VISRDIRQAQVLYPGNRKMCQWNNHVSRVTSVTFPKGTSFGRYKVCEDSRSANDRLVDEKRRFIYLLLVYINSL
jgi:hypothetical protein